MVGEETFEVAQNEFLESVRHRRQRVAVSEREEICRVSKGEAFDHKTSAFVEKRGELVERRDVQPYRERHCGQVHLCKTRLIKIF